MFDQINLAWETVEMRVCLFGCLEDIVATLNINLGNKKYCYILMHTLFL